jgi:hypothetical protein
MSTNDPLDKILKRHEIPERSDGYWEYFPQRVLSKIKETPQMHETSAGFLSYRWVQLSCIFGMMLLLAYFGFKQKPQQFSQYLQLYGELALTFPNQLEAVVITGKQTELVLSETPNVPRSTILLLNIPDLGSGTTILTTSGQRVQIGSESCEVFLDGEGHVVLLGNQWVWSTDSANTARAPYQMSATILGGKDV